MKKTLLFLVLMLLSVAESYSQADFNTGAIGVSVNEYGKIIVSAPNGLEQMWRTSILVGSSPTTVFDYQNDAEQHDPTVLVPNPTQSDFEIYGAYDNSYSGDPPDVIVKLNAYGWNNGGYIIVKFTIQNSGTTSFNALPGLDIIPYIDEEDGYDTVSYNSTTEVIRFHRGNQTNTGIKLLTGSLTSLTSFEYYDGYYVDSDYWTWMNSGSVQTMYPSNSASGSVSITAQETVPLAPGVTTNVYYAFAVGPDRQTMSTHMAAAVQKYQSMVVGIPDIEPSVTGFNLGQNSPNPFSKSTTISYKLPEEGFVTLKVYDLIGNEVATLVNSNQTRGSHTVDFNSTGLSTGVYYYTLSSGSQVQSKKMFLIR